MEDTPTGSRACVEGKETKGTVTFGKVARLTEDLRICRDMAKSIKVKLYGHSPEESGQKSEETPTNPVFFDRLFDELHTLKDIAAGIKVTLSEINENL